MESKRRLQFHSLSHRNFRLYLLGQSLSLVGTWTQDATMAWLVDRLSGSALVQGVVGSISKSPALFLPPIAGVLTDRFNRKHLLVGTQTLAMMQAFALAALVAFTDVKIWQIIVFNFLLSAINAFDWPIRQTFIGDTLEDRDDLAHAISMNSSLVNGSRLLGPAIAAVLISLVGEAGGFFVNGLSFLAVIACIAAMRFRKRPRSTAHAPLWAGLGEGWSYVTKSRPIRAILLVVSAACLFGLPYSLLMPRYSHTQFVGVDPLTTYAVLLTAPGIGAFAASLWCVWLGLGRVTVRIVFSPILAGCCMAGMSLCTSVTLAALLLGGAGFGMLMLINSANTLLQTIAAPDMRGRVMSYYAVAFAGVAPFGNLLVPSLAQWLSITRALQISGAACCLAGVMFAIALPRFVGEIRERSRGEAPRERPLSTVES